MTAAQSIQLDAEGTGPQMRFWHSPARFRMLSGGIGSGKTWAGALECLRQPAGSAGMVVTPTSDMSEEPFKTLRAIAGPAVVEVKRGKGDRFLRLSDGKEIYFRSADNPDRLRGPNLGWFWMDEAGQMKDEYPWNVMIGRLRRQPGRGWITTTPAGFNWLYDVFIRKGTGDPEIETVIAPTASNNLHDNPNFLASVKSRYSSEFARQELEGEFVDFSNSRIRREWIMRETPPPGLPVVLGVDLAISQRDGADYTAIVALSRAPDGRIFVLDAARDRLPFHSVLEFIKARAAHWNPVAIAIEAVQYQAAIVQELLRTTTLPVRGIQPGKDKLARFAPVEARYEQRLIHHAAAMPPAFEDELLAFPNGNHDDMADALAYAFAALPQVGQQAAAAGSRIFGGSHALPLAASL